MEATETKRLITPTETPRPRYTSIIALDIATLKRYAPGFPSSPDGIYDAYFGPKWYNDCGRKRAYFNQHTADHRCSQMVKRSGKILNSYFCYWCEWWHVGNRPEK